MSDENAEVEAQQVIEQLKKGKKLHDQFAKQFREQYTIAGSLMSEWKEHFVLKIPPDMNPQLCQSLDAKLVGLHQEATFLKAEAEARLAACTSANQEKYRTRFTELVTEYKQQGAKLPAKETLQALAEESISGLKSAVTHAEIELAFWKEILNDLANTRKIIENITINLASEAKALYNERYIDSLNSKKSY